MAYALITGAGKGIGKAIALELAARGYDLLLVSRTEKDLAELSEQARQNYHVQASYWVGDLSETGAAERVYAWVNSLNISLEVLVNNAGYGMSGLFLEQDFAKLENMMQLNMLSLTAFIHRFAPTLQQSRRSYILNVASTAAYQATPGLSTYAASKTFVLALSRGLNQEFKRSGLSVSCICPGPTNTAFFERANLGARGLEQVKKVHMESHEVARIAVEAMLKGKPEVVPGLQNKSVAFLSWLLPKSVIESVADRLLRGVMKD